MKYLPSQNDPNAQLTPFEDYADSNEALRQAVQAPGTAPRFELYQRVHRIMRGRYLLAAILGAICALPLAIVGYRSQRPIYKSEGHVRIAREVDPILGRSPENEALYDVDAFIQSQTVLMTSNTVLNIALNDPAWKATGRGNSPGVLASFTKSLSVEHPLHTELVTISYSDADPKVATAGVSAEISAFEDYCNHQGDVKNNVKLAALQDEKIEVAKQIADIESRIEKIANESGGADLDGIYNIQLDSVAKIEARVTDAGLALSMVQQQLSPKDAARQLTANQIGMLDQTMRTKIDAADKVEQDLNMNRLRLGPQHPYVVQLQQQLKLERTEIEQYASEYRDLQVRLAANPNSMRRGGLDLLVESVEALKQQKDSADRLLVQAKQVLSDIGLKRYTVRKAQDDVKALVARSQAIDARIDQLQLESKNVGRMTVADEASTPGAPKDLRPQMAGAAGLLGFCLPFGLMVLVGLFSTRYRTSEDAERSIGNTPLLGILPTLPAQLTDPEQAAVAAHCIHQIRIMLQLSDSGPSKVFMITSANTGDGKTSLTMALGLSFAASGSRTLVMDCDVVGQGLSHRLKVGPAGGVLQSLAAGTMQGRFKRTTTPNLWILPVGTADPSMAGSFSPGAIGALIDEARQNFDVILIDTGPVLGSLEAHAVARHADGVVLTIARGQQQPLVDRALLQLRMLGANVSGLVFNRAEKRDFHRSVMSTSIRSMSQTPHPQRTLVSGEPSRFGPLASSVMSFMPERTSAGGAPGAADQARANAQHIAPAPSTDIDKPHAADASSAPTPPDDAQQSDRLATAEIVQAGRVSPPLALPPEVAAEPTLPATPESAHRLDARLNVELGAARGFDAEDEFSEDSSNRAGDNSDNEAHELAVHSGGMAVNQNYADSAIAQRQAARVEADGGRRFDGRYQARIPASGFEADGNFERELDQNVLEESLWAGAVDGEVRFNRGES